MFKWWRQRRERIKAEEQVEYRERMAELLVIAKSPQKLAEWMDEIECRVGEAKAIGIIGIVT